MNFNWLNELPDNRWQVTQDGPGVLTVTLTAFLNISRVPTGIEWEPWFNQWAGGQERRYIILPSAATGLGGAMIRISAELDARQRG